jgi:hypothetical protein
VEEWDLSLESDGEVRSEEELEEEETDRAISFEAGSLSTPIV